MFTLLLVFHILVCFSLVTVVLLQSGKGGGLAGGAFGGTAQTVFGGRGATDFLTRATMVLGAAFFLTSVTLALMSTRGTATRSLLQEAARKAGAAAPAVPGGGTPQRAPLREAPLGAPSGGGTPAPGSPPSSGPQQPSTPPPGGGK